jgi:hypothetical protein
MTHLKIILPIANAALGAILATLGIFLKSELSDLHQLRADVVQLRESSAATTEFRRWFEGRIDRLEDNLSTRLQRVEQQLTQQGNHAMQASEYQGVVFKNGPAILLARVVGANGAALVQADVSTIVYTISQLDEDHPDEETPISGHSGVSLVVANVIYNALQLDALWDADATGYNFKHVVDISPNQAFPTAGKSYRVKHTLTPTSGEIILVRFRLAAI